MLLRGKTPPSTFLHHVKTPVDDEIVKKSFQNSDVNTVNVYMGIV